MSHYVWVRRPEDIGDEAVDLHACVRLITLDPDRYEDCERLCVYYRLCDGRWVRHVKEPPSSYPDPDPPLYFEDFEFIHPVVAARDLYWEFDEKIPHELREFRTIVEDTEAYFRWVQENARKDGTILPLRSPYWDALKLELRVGDVVCRRYGKDNAPNHFRLFEEFQAQKWNITIPNPLDSEQTLKDTVDSINDKLLPESPIIFCRRHKRPAWRYRISRTSSQHLSSPR